MHYEIEGFIGWAKEKYLEENWNIEIKSKSWLKQINETIFPEKEIRVFIDEEEYIYSSPDFILKKRKNLYVFQFTFVSFLYSFVFHPVSIFVTAVF
eukprot:05454.XXX_76210_76553_1 [CDS] Oithona nana genome sequencing.